MLLYLYISQRAHPYIADLHLNYYLYPYEEEAED